MAVVNTGPYQAFKAGADLSTKQDCLVKLDANGELELATNGSRGFPLVDDPAEGKYGTIQIYGIARVVAGDAVTMGAELTSDANGKAVEAGAEDEICGVAFSAATGAGQLINMWISPGGVVGPKGDPGAQGDPGAPGNTNVVSMGAGTLANESGVAETTVTDELVAVGDIVMLQATSATALAADMYVSEVAAGSFKVTHTAAPGADSTFSYMVLRPPADSGD